MDQDKTTRKITVPRERGICDYCGTETDLIGAYDPSIYDGLACAPCIVGGKTCDQPVDGELMRPMVFVAKAYQGVQPFARMLENADRQRGNPRGTRVELEKERRRQEEEVLGHRPRNRKERRAVEAHKRRKG